MNKPLEVYNDVYETMEQVIDTVQNGVARLDVVYDRELIELMLSCLDDALDVMSYLHMRGVNNSGN